MRSSVYLAAAFALTVITVTVVLVGRRVVTDSLRTWRRDRDAGKGRV